MRYVAVYTRYLHPAYILKSTKATLQAMISNLENINNDYNIILIQAWKGMLDGESILKAGWLHGMKLHSFGSPEFKESKFVIMGKLYPMK